MKPAKPIYRVALLFVLTTSLLLLSGCGFFSRVFAPRVAEQPHPPLTQHSFAEFDRRKYLPDRLVISAIHLDTPVVELGWSATTDPSGRVFSQWDVAQNAAGWHKNSAQLGQNGNVVMSGHNNVLGSVFRELDQLDAGDTAVVWSGNVEYVYAVDTVVIVPDRTATATQRQENAHWIADFGDDRLTLVSCWPRDDNSHRIIVVGHRINGEEVAGRNSAQQ